MTIFDRTQRAFPDPNREHGEAIERLFQPAGPCLSVDAIRQFRALLNGGQGIETFRGTLTALTTDDLADAAHFISSRMRAADGPYSPKSLDAYIIAGQELLGRNLITNAAEFFETALIAIQVQSLLSTDPSACPELAARALTGLARVALHRGDRDGFESNVRDAVQVVREAHGEVHTALVEPLAILGDLARAWGWHDVFEETCDHLGRLVADPACAASCHAPFASGILAFRALDQERYRDACDGFEAATKWFESYRYEGLEYFWFQLERADALIRLDDIDGIISAADAVAKDFERFVAWLPSLSNESRGVLIDLLRRGEYHVEADRVESY